MKKLFFASLLALAMIGFAQEQEPPKEGPKGPGRGQKEARGNRPPMQGGRNIMAEVQEIHGKVLAKYDADKDGKLSAEERAAVDADLNLPALQEKMRMARAWNMYKRLDKDNDGVLSEEELAGMKNMRPAGGRPGAEGQRDRGNKPPRREKKDKKQPKAEE